jgi:histidinol-phosphate/aromatic aminotransferase/cobyric acid decarboxylase-like protein
VSGDPLRVHGDRIASDGMLDFAVNVWPGPRPAELQRRLADALAGERYPDGEPARAAVAAAHGRDPEEVLLLNGACEAFWLLAHALHPHRACCVHPSFTEPEAALRAVGSEVVRVFRKPPEWRLDPLAVPATADLVFLGNPNNPTGTLDRAATIRALVRPSRIVVVDEAFMDFVPAETESLARARLRGVVVVRSLTKLWALAGIRAGYLLAEPALVTLLDASRQPWPVNALACAAIAACAADRPARESVAADVGAARALLLEQLAAIEDVSVWPSAANFVLVELPDASVLAARLLDRGLAVRRAGNFPGLTERHLRIAVRRPCENAVLARAIRAELAR